MSLKNWEKDGQLKSCVAELDEISNLLRIVERDIADASIELLSADRRFITAYNAALQLATITLRASGCRTNPHRAGHHRLSMIALEETLGEEGREFSDYFNACRIKRNTSDYTNCGEISLSEAEELVAEVKAFSKIVKDWLKRNHPSLYPYNYKA